VGQLPWLDCNANEAFHSPQPGAKLAPGQNALNIRAIPLARPQLGDEAWKGDQRCADRRCERLDPIKRVTRLPRREIDQAQEPTSHHPEAQFLPVPNEARENHQNDHRRHDEDGEP